MNTIQEHLDALQTAYAAKDAEIASLKTRLSSIDARITAHEGLVMAEWYLGARPKHPEMVALNGKAISASAIVAVGKILDHAKQTIADTNGYGTYMYLRGDVLKNTMSDTVVWSEVAWALEAIGYNVVVTDSGVDGQTTYDPKVLQRPNEVLISW